MSEMYKPRDLCNILHITRLTYVNWLNAGYIKPSRRSTGKGVASKFNRVRVLQCILFKKLVDYGMSHSLASQIAYTKSVKKGFANIDLVAVVDLPELGVLTIDLSDISGAI